MRNQESGPTVSVVIVTYNQEQHVVETVRSFADQVTDFPFEIIVTDDASTDGTPELLQALADELGDRMTLILNAENAGVTGNANRGLERCTGEFIAMTGGDDIALPGRLQRQVRALRDHPTAGACVSAAEAFDSDTGAVLRTIDPATRHGRSRFEARDYVVLGHIGASPAYMFRRGVAPALFETRLPVASDSIYFIETALKSWVLAIPDVLTRYRVHGKAVSAGGVGADRFVAEGILAMRYPQLVPFLRHWRARVYRTQALSLLLQGRSRDARPYFAESVRARPNLRSLVGLGLCHLPEGVARRILFRYNPMLRSRYDDA